MFRINIQEQCTDGKFALQRLIPMREDDSSMAANNIHDLITRFTPEQIAKLQALPTPQARLNEIQKEEYGLCEEDIIIAKEILKVPSTQELSDEELDQVAGGKISGDLMGGAALERNGPCKHYKRSPYFWGPESCGTCEYIAMVRGYDDVWGCSY